MISLNNYKSGDLHTTQRSQRLRREREQITISLPNSKKLHYRIVSLTGQLIEQGKIINPTDSYTFNLSSENAGVYFIHLTDENREILHLNLVQICTPNSVGRRLYAEKGKQ